jgi:hydrogenase nickel incorporation protein HypA/HybF
MSIHPRLQSIFDQLANHNSIQIVMGELFPLTEEQLQLQWNALVEKSPFANTKLNIRIVPALQQCMACFEKYHPMNKETVCPYCGSVGAKILSGEEFYLESIPE